MVYVFMQLRNIEARVVKRVDTRDLKSLGRKAMLVRLQPRAPIEFDDPETG